MRFLPSVLAFYRMLFTNKLDLYLVIDFFVRIFEIIRMGGGGASPSFIKREYKKKTRGGVKKGSKRFC